MATAKEEATQYLFTFQFVTFYSKSKATDVNLYLALRSKSPASFIASLVAFLLVEIFDFAAPLILPQQRRKKVTPGDPERASISGSIILTQEVIEDAMLASEKDNNAYGQEDDGVQSTQKSDDGDEARAGDKTEFGAKNNYCPTLEATYLNVMSDDKEAAAQPKTVKVIAADETLHKKQKSENKPFSLKEAIRENISYVTGHKQFQYALGLTQADAVYAEISTVSAIGKIAGFGNAVLRIVTFGCTEFVQAFEQWSPGLVRIFARRKQFLVSNEFINRR
jgi:hypothetical protein